MEGAYIHRFYHQKKRYYLKGLNLRSSTNTEFAMFYVSQSLIILIIKSSNFNLSYSYFQLLEVLKTLTGLGFDSMTSYGKIQ